VNFSDQQPVLIDGRVYIPIRDLFETLGFDVEWIDETKTAVLTRGDEMILIPVNDFSFDMRWDIFPLQTQIIGDRIMFPPKRLLERLGYDFYWDVGQNEIFITTRTVQTQETREIVYSLSDDFNLRNLPRGTEIAHIVSDFRYLRGGDRLTFSQYQNSNSIYVTERTRHLEGLYINIDPLNLVQGAYYTLEVSGRAISPIPDGASMELGIGNVAVGGPIGISAPVSESNPNFTLALHAFTTETESGYPLTYYTEFMVETNQQAEFMSFAVDSIIVRHVLLLATHTVAAGESITRIAQHYFGNAAPETIEHLRTTNNLPTADSLYVGQTLVILPLEN
jgi:hypothetical protein